MIRRTKSVWGRRLFMAETKKIEATKAADTKTATVTTPVAAPAAKTAPVAQSAKTEEKKETEAKKPAAKKPGRKPAAKKPGRKPAAAKKETAAKTTTKKTAVKETIHVQFSGKTYTTEDLVKIAKDVWKYDLKKKVGDFKSVELYVKPEESTVYYVINGEEKGSFNI